MKRVTEVANEIAFGTSKTLFQGIMCMIAESIRLGAKWHPVAKILQATTTTNLGAVKRITIQLDPFTKNTQAIRCGIVQGINLIEILLFTCRSAWYALTSRKVRETNLNCTVGVNVVNDRSEPRMHVDLSAFSIALLERCECITFSFTDDGRQLLFKCAHLSDTQILNYLMHLASPQVDKKSK